MTTMLLVAGFYWGAHNPFNSAQVLWVGPYKDKAECADMYGSAIYSHPWRCHLTGLPADCGVTGKGFAYPKGYPDTDSLIAGDLNCTWMKAPPSRGWCFLYYSLLDGPRTVCGPSLRACRRDYRDYSAMALLTPGDEIGYYSDRRCPGAPCWTANTSTACE